MKKKKNPQKSALSASSAFPIAILATILLLGCEQYIDFTGRELPPRIVVNSIINAQSDSARVKISESVFIFSDQQPAIVEDLDIQLRINGIEQEIEKDEIEGIHTWYNFATSLNPGDRIEISAHTPTHGTVRGYDVVPHSTVEITNINHSWEGSRYRPYLRLHITIRDNSNQRNFYRILIRSGAYFVPSSEEELDIEELNLWWVWRDVYVGDEILFSRPGGNTSVFRLFNNNLFRGQEYTLNVYIQEWKMVACANYTPRQFVQVEIQTLSENLYRSLRSQEAALNAANNLFEEPVTMFSNIEGGFGILGVYTSMRVEKLVVERGE